MRRPLLLLPVNIKMSRPTDIIEVFGTVSPDVLNVEIKIGHGSARTSLEEELVRRDSFCLGSSGTPSAASSIFEGNDGSFTPRLPAVAEEPEPLSLRKRKDCGAQNLLTNNQTPTTAKNDAGAPTMWSSRREPDGNLVMAPLETQSQDRSASVSNPGNVLPDKRITSKPPQRKAPSILSTSGNSREYAEHHIWDKQAETDDATIRYQELLSNALLKRRDNNIPFKDLFMMFIMNYLLGQSYINDQSKLDGTRAECSISESILENASSLLPKTTSKEQQKHILALFKTSHPSIAKEQFRTRRGPLWDIAVSVLERQGMQPTHLTEFEFVQMVCGSDISAWIQENISRVSRRSMEQYLRARHLLEEAGMHPQKLSEEFMCMFEWMPSQEQETFVNEYKQLELNMLGAKLSQTRIESELQASAQMLDDVIEKEASAHDNFHTSDHRRASGASSTSQKSEVSDFKAEEYCYSGVSHFDWYGIEGPVAWETEAPRVAKAFGVRFTSDEPKVLENITSPGRQSLRKKLSSAFHLGSMNLKPRRSHMKLKDATF